MSASPQGELPFVGGVAEVAATLRPADPPRPRAVSPVAEAPAPEAAAVATSRELWLAVQLAQPERFADIALEFTSRAVLDPPDLLLLELRGSLRLFGGFRALFRQLRGRLPDDACFALAPVPLAAAAFARAGRRLRCTDLPRMREALRTLPLAALPWPDDTLERLVSMGLATIGDVQRLPREGLARRFGPGLLALLDRLFGRQADPRRGVVPAARFSERIELSAETFDQQRLLQALGPALARLEAFLRGRQRGLLALRVDLQHRRVAPTRCVLRLARPGFRSADFTSLLAERLARERLPAPVRGLRLLAGRLVEFPAASADLWRAGEQGGRLSGESFQLLERLRSRLGDTAVRGLRLVEEHRPERAGGRCAPDGDAADEGVPSKGDPAAKPAQASGVMRRTMPLAWPPPQSRRPLWLLGEPRRLALREAAGRLQPCLDDQPLTLLHGPERIESGWWDAADVQRDYYVARDRQGACWWIFREPAARPAWFLHGCFG